MVTAATGMMKNSETVRETGEIAIGMLVFVLTKNAWENYTNTTIASLPYVPPISPQPTTATFPNKPGSYPYTWRDNSIENVDEFFAKNISVEQNKIDDLKDLLTSYNEMCDSNKLGMSTMSGDDNRPKNRKERRAVKVQKKATQTLQNAYKNPSSSNQINTGANNTSGHSYSSNHITINFPNIGNTSRNIYTTTSTAFGYIVKGFKTLKDYYSNETTTIEQQEDWPEEEKEKISNSGFTVFTGKPFHGIVVDKFSPEACSERGEKVSAEEMNLPVLYKVLFGENNLLWVSGDNLIPMKSNKHPLKGEV
jgi:hypothetical protein